MVVRYIHHLPIAKRKKARETTKKIVEAQKRQNILLKELYLSPNEDMIKEADKFLKGRISVEEYTQKLEQTRERYKEILKW
jgi:hypothetical protein